MFNTIEIITDVQLQLIGPKNLKWSFETRKISISAEQQVAYIYTTTVSEYIELQKLKEFTRKNGYTRKIDTINEFEARILDSNSDKIDDISYYYKKFDEFMKREISAIHFRMPIDINKIKNQYWLEENIYIAYCERTIDELNDVLNGKFDW